MRKHSESEVVKVPLNKLQPYWRNPRNNAASIAKVKQSVEAYGFVNPIIVDQNYVIIAGHSRYRALMYLQAKTADVIVSDMDAKLAHEYRLVDNKTGEYATWTAQLDDELKDFDDTMKISFFPALGADSNIVSVDELLAPNSTAQEAAGVDENIEVELICPFTLEVFYVNLKTALSAPSGAIVDGYTK